MNVYTRVRVVFLCFALKFWRVGRLKMYVALPHDFGQSGTWFRVRVALGLGFKGNKFACQFVTYFFLNETEGFSPPPKTTSSRNS